MTLANMPVFVNTKNNKKSYRNERTNNRNAVKTAISLYQNGEISEELLKAIAEAALAFEIYEGVEIKLSKKNKKILGE